MLRLVRQQVYAQAATTARLDLRPASPLASAAMMSMTEAEPRGLKTFRRVVRLGVVVGMLATAWQIGAVIGAL